MLAALRGPVIGVFGVPGHPFSEEAGLLVRRGAIVVHRPDCEVIDKDNDPTKRDIRCHRDPTSIVVKHRSTDPGYTQSVFP